MAQTGKKRLEGKVAIVTGGGRGIGRHEAQLLLEQGAKLVINDLGCSSAGRGADPDVAKAAVADIRALGGEAVADASDVATVAGARALVQVALDTYGRIDILLNNAGIARPIRIDETEEEDWDVVVDVNLKAPYATIRAAAPTFIKQKSGVIVNTSSPSGFGQYSNAAYCAAKEGVIGLTRAVARDLGQYGVRCNAIRPVARFSQMVSNEMTNAIRHSEEVLGIPSIWNRWSAMPRATPIKQEFVAAVVVWLCTDACKEVNGRDFYIGGSDFGILPEPELTRACFNAEGWDLDKLDEPYLRAYLLGDVHNRFSGKRP